MDLIDSALAIQAQSVYLPENFHAGDFLPRSLHRYADRARKLIDVILRKHALDLRYRDGQVPLKAEYLRKLFPDNYTFMQVRRHLVDAGVITCSGSYQVGVRSMTYAIGAEFGSQPIRRVALTDRRLVERVLADRRRKIEELAPVPRELYDRLQMLEIDRRAAAAAPVYTPANRAALELSVAMIADGCFRLGTCNYGRVHSNLTGLKRELRNYLTAHGKPLVNLDTRNSQPLALTPMLLDRYEGQALPPDVTEYIALCEGGQFYDSLMAHLGIPDQRRTEFKTAFFGRVFFCKNHPENDTAKEFGRLFPNVYRLIREAKARNYKALARNLQRHESSLMIGKVAARFLREFPGEFLGTIHDSTVPTADRGADGKAITLAEYAKIGLKPTIKIEHLTPPTRGN